MKDIYVNMMFTSADYLFPIQLFFLGNISNENKKRVRFNVMSAESNPNVKILVDELNKLGLESHFIHMPNASFMDKIRWASSQPSKYSIKMDDDTFMSDNSWDDWFNNIDILEDDDILTLSPLLSTGIPTVDWYCDELFSEEDRDELYRIFKTIRFPSNINGADYTSLNAAVESEDPWNPTYYYGLVKKLNHYYKGIHPMRMSRDAQLKLNDYTLKNFYKFCNSEGSYIEISDRPYLCPQLNSIKTKTWKKLIDRQDLFRDDWDEVPMNLYKEENNLAHAFLHGVFGVHSVYNWVGTEYDKRYYAQLYMNKLKELYAKP